MESVKRYESDEDDNSEHKSQENPQTFNSWKETKGNCNNDTADSNSRKRKIVTESENSENTNLSSEKTLLIPKRENNTSLFAEVQTSDLYDLKPEFLESLGITPPLSKWVYVINFRCDKAELKEVFSLAGNVILCSVVTIRLRYANIMFSHPLEAVQAISMFNGQILYGMKLKVTMMNPPSDTIILPKGLKDIGPGLGFNGRPLRDIVSHYKKYTNHQLSLIDASLFSRQNDDDEKELQDSKSTDSDKKSKDSKDNTNPSNRRKYFKITNIEDLSVKDMSQDTSVSENQIKKPRSDEPDERSSSSDEESADARIVSNLSARLKEKNKTQGNETPPKDPRLEGSSASTIRVNLGPPTTASNQNCQPPMSRPLCPQFRTNQPLRNTGPSVPIGPRPGANFCSPGPAIAPVGPHGSMMGPMGPNGPIAPLRPSGPLGPFPTTGSAGPPPGTMGPRVPLGPFGSFRPPYPNVPPAAQGPHSVLGGIVPTPPGQNPMPNDVITLQFRNLPPSTTFPLLCDQVSQCGQVLSLQLTTPGCAIVRFLHRVHAERCYQFFNGKRIDGCVIEVRFV